MEPYDEWAERMACTVPPPSIATVLIDGDPIYACAKDQEGRVVDVWNPDDIEAPFDVDRLH